MSRLLSMTEIARTLRFAVVGVGTAAFYALLFFVFRDLGVPATAASLIALGIAVVTQYFAHSLFTFRSAVAERGQIARFFATVATGALVSVLVTEILVPGARLPEWVGVAVVVFGLPVTNFIIFRLWVFRDVDSRLAGREGAE